MRRIPRHFHFVFGLKPQTEPFHLVYYLCLESCRQVNRPDRITLYYHHLPYGEWWERIRVHLELVKVPLAEQVSAMAYSDHKIGTFSYAHHADFIRLEQLLTHGGVYADIDTLFVNPIPDQLYEESCVLGRELPVYMKASGRFEESVCNALIMAEPNAPFVQRWLEAMPAAFNGNWSEHSCQLAHRLSAMYPDDIHLEPERSFYPYMWIKEDLNELLLERRQRDWDRVYSIHLWNHLWWASRLFKFCPFNEERLTERYVRLGCSTYALAARRFLPPWRERGVFRFAMHWIRDIGRECWGRRHEFKRWCQGA
jgi:hypothetical protein